MSKNDKKARRPKPRQPELSIRTSGFRLELDRLPRFPKALRWCIGLLIGAGLLVAKLFFHVRVGS